MMTPASVGGCVACALMRLLRPDEDPVLGLLDAWPLTVHDVLGDSGPSEVFRSAPGGGIGDALERLLRPDRQMMALAIYSLLDHTGDDLLLVPGRPDLPGEPPATAEAA